MVAISSGGMVEHVECFGENHAGNAEGVANVR